MAGINVVNLPAKAAAAITANDGVMLFNASETTQTPFIEAVAQANVLNSCVCLRETRTELTSAQILNLGSTPVQIIAPAPVGHITDVISVFGFMDYGSAPYATELTCQVESATASMAMFTSELFESTFDRYVKFTPVVVAIGSNSNMKTGEAVNVTTFTGGDPTGGGGGTAIIYATFRYVAI